MRFRHVVVPALLVLGLASPPLAAQEIDTSKVTVHSTSIDDFDKPVFECVEYCVELTGVRQTFECTGFFLPPTTGCDLPWVDSGHPTGGPRGVRDLCVPEEPEFGGFVLREDVDRVRRRVHFKPDCTSEATEVELQQLPDRGNPPRPCPDPGVWTETNFGVESIRFVRCN